MTTRAPTTTWLTRTLLLGALACGLAVVAGIWDPQEGPPSALAQQNPGTHADPSEPPAEPIPDKVSIECMVVLATNDHARVDARLKPLLPHLRHLNYTGYSVLDVRTEDLGPTQETTFSIAGGRRLQIDLLEFDATRARIRVRMFNAQGRVLDTTVSIHRDRSFIVAGPAHEGGVLILPLTARY